VIVRDAYRGVFCRRGRRGHRVGVGDKEGNKAEKEEGELQRQHAPIKRDGEHEGK
jgi:hypothetical protein